MYNKQQPKGTTAHSLHSVHRLHFTESVHSHFVAFALVHKDKTVQNVLALRPIRLQHYAIILTKVNYRNALCYGTTA